MGKSGDKKSKKQKSTELATETTDPVTADAPVVEDAEPTKQLLLSPIATPLADAKLKKRVFKLLKKSAKSKLLKRGVKEVVKAVRKEQRGIVLLAGDTAPVDVVAHIPVVCEDRDIPYLFIDSKEELGLAAQTKRATSALLILRQPQKGTLPAEELKEYQETYDDLHKKVKLVQPLF